MAPPPPGVTSSLRPRVPSRLRRRAYTPTPSMGIPWLLSDDGVDQMIVASPRASTPTSTVTGPPEIRPAELCAHVRACHRPSCGGHGSRLRRNRTTPPRWRRRDQLRRTWSSSPPRGAVWAQACRRAGPGARATGRTAGQSMSTVDPFRGEPSSSGSPSDTNDPCATVTGGDHAACCPPPADPCCDDAAVTAAAPPKMFQRTLRPLHKREHGFCLLRDAVAR